MENYEHMLVGKEAKTCTLAINRLEKSHTMGRPWAEILPAAYEII